MQCSTPDRQSYNPVTSPPTDVVESEWRRTPIPNQRTFMTSAPVTDNRWVYVGSGTGSNGHNGFITAFDGASGERQWKTEITRGRIRDLGYIDDRILAVSSDHESDRGALASLRTTDGTKDWQVELPSPSIRGFIITDGWAYTTTQEGGLTAVSIDGSDRWNQNVDVGEEYLSTAPCAASGWLYVGTDQGRLVAFDTETGHQGWQRTITTDEHRPRIQTTPTVAGETIYVTATDYHLYAVNRADGTVRWKTRLLSRSRGNSIPSVAVVEDTLYVNTIHGGLLALRRDDGSERWRSGKYGGQFPPAAAGNLIVVPTTGGKVEAYDPGGTRRWQFEMEVPDTDGLTAYAMRPGVAMAHDRVYVALNDGRVFSLGVG